MKKMHVKFESTICRICLQSNATYSLFENELLLEKFSFVTLLEPLKTDNLPSNLCQECILAIRVSARLKKQALVSNAELKSYLKKMNESFLTLPSRTKFSEEDDISDINVNELALLCVEENDEKDDYKLIDENDYESNNKSNVNLENDLKRNTDFCETQDDEEYDIEELLDETNTLEYDEIPGDINKLLKFKKRSNSDTINSDFQSIDSRKRTLKIKNKEDYKGEKNYEEYDDGEVHQDIESDASEDIFQSNIINENKNKTNNRKYKKRRYVPDIIKVSSVLKDTDSAEEKKIIGIINDTFRCGECDNMFTTKLNLDRHMEIHLNKRKAFSCETCGKLFTQLNSVREHMLTHTGEKPFKCDICQKAFSRRQIFKRHLTTHSKIQKYSCKECNQKFTVKRTLMLHISRVHGDGQTIEHKCQICNKIYRSKYTLSDHLQNVHNITI